MSNEKEVKRINALSPIPLKRRVQAQLALPGQSLTSLLTELLEQWLAEQDREQAATTRFLSVPASCNSPVVRPERKIL